MIVPKYQAQQAGPLSKLAPQQPGQPWPNSITTFGFYFASILLCMVARYCIYHLFETLKFTHTHSLYTYIYVCVCITRTTLQSATQSIIPLITPQSASFLTIKTKIGKFLYLIVDSSSFLLSFSLDENKSRPYS